MPVRRGGSGKLWPEAAIPATAIGLLAAVALCGCDTSPAANNFAPNSPAAAPANKASTSAKPSRTKPVATPAVPVAADDTLATDDTGDPRPPSPFRQRAENPGGNLANLVAQAQRRPFQPPAFDEARLNAAGIRRIDGQHLTLYTDQPAAPEIEELPRVFDAAVPLWCQYFGIEPAEVADWHMVGSLMGRKEPFLAVGLLPEHLPDFPNGLARGGQLWLYDQPSGYYRRHLLLHEGTHAFMERFLGGAGPPWYMEGMAELLGTHRWDGTALSIAHMPASKEESPYWGRIKTIRDAHVDGSAMTLEGIMQYDSRAHLRQEPYSWCWAAAAFFDAHPSTQAAFRELKRATRDRSEGFSRRFREKLAVDWPRIVQDWELFVAECDYGYDFARAAVAHRPAAELPAGGAEITVATDRGWQSSGIHLEAGRTYRLTAAGRYTVIAGPPAWPCEAGGVTIRYAGGRPLGMLLAAVADDDAPTSPTPLAQPAPIGLSALLTPETTGTLYLKINEPASGLADNEGTLQVRIELHP